VRIGKTEVVERGREVQVRAPVTWHGKTEYLWYSVQRRYADHLSSETLDAFVVGLLLPAMTERQDIHIEGPVSEKLYWNLTRSYMRIMSSINPVFEPVRIFPAELTAHRPTVRPSGVATGFSGGIDSFCVLADHLGPIPSGRRITHLIYSNVGAHPGADRGRFLDQYERLAPCGEELGLPFIRIDSNLNDFYRVKFEATHTSRNISAALVLQNLLAVFYYASGYRYEDCYVGPAKSPAYADPLAVHLLSTETLDCVSDGCQYSRVQKTMRVAEFELSRRYLDVCVSRKEIEGNCAVCWKCARTLLTLEILGKIEDYEDVFALDRYRATHRLCLARVMAKDNAYRREIRTLAKERAYRFPLGVATLARFRSLGPFLNELSPRRLLRRIRTGPLSTMQS